MTSASGKLPSEPTLPERFVAVFDSGVGGLTILRQLRAALPHLPTVYYADQAHMPYGPQPADVIHDYVESAVRGLIDRGAQARRARLSLRQRHQPVSPARDLP